jgi:hypothetical protein
VLMAFTMWFLGLLGVAPTELDFQRFDREFRERGHHLTVDFGGQRSGGTRWGDPNWSKRPVIALGYNYMIDRRYNGVAFEVLGQSIGKLLKGGRDDNSFFVGGGLAYFPIRHLRVFLHGGAEIDLSANAQGVGRAGLGYRFMFFNLGMQPYVYFQTTTSGEFGWQLGFRFEY